VDPGRDREGELQVLGLGLDGAAGEDGEGVEDLERDGVEVWAGAGDDEELEGGDGELSGAGCQEWEGAGGLPEDGSVVAVLFAFLTDD
jgi:hypothetical protein